MAKITYVVQVDEDYNPASPSWFDSTVLSPLDTLEMARSARDWLATRRGPEGVRIVERVDTVIE